MNGLRRTIPLVLASLLAASSAEAGGLYLTDRGVRPLGRGGAFVAGADDLHAVWYNPAGLADAGSAILVDFAWLNFSAEFARSTQVTDAGGTIRQIDYPEVKGATPFLPLPTLAGSYNFGKQKQYTVAFSMIAPYTAVANYPETLNGQPAPSRYSLITLEGSALVDAGIHFAYKISDKVRIGAGLQATVGKFASKVVFSASPSDRLIGAPEDPQYDALSQLDVGPIVAPSGNVGIIVAPIKQLRLGLSGQLPSWINAPATVKVRLPTAAPFDRATQDGDEAQVKFRLPPIVRAGVELRTEPSQDARLRVEAAYVREFWSLHDSIDIESKNVRIYDITGFPSPFGVAPISIPRNFQDSNSFRLGGELGVKLSGYWVDFRGGVSYETSAIPNDWVSPLTYDANKFIPSLGGSLFIGEHWRMDAMGALVFMGTRYVAPEDAQVPRINPVRGNPTDTEPVNGGEYNARAIVLGVGVGYKF